ncbi:MAG: hypothetical protein B7Y41_04715 [Hydrogenophilales bacterium 28-61-23]|nr:MAG: hypothetical protein B7Y41_04715 [Hydrogenophilales bacterium 28-61-23]
MLEYIPGSVTRILEIGCGNGKFGAAIRSSRNVYYVGVDLMPKAVEAAKKVLDVSLQADIEVDDLPFQHNSFDCLIMNDVLEHLRDPWGTLKKMMAYLAPGGYVVASLPNIRYYSVVKDLLINRQWRYAENGVLDKTHIRFFTDKTIRDMFQGVNVEILTLNGINGTKFPWKFGLLNLLLANALDDMRYMQFALLGRKAL